MVSNRVMWLSSLILKHFHHTLNSNPTPISSHSPSPLPTGSDNHRSTSCSVDLPIGDIWYKWNYTTVGFVVFFLLLRSFSNSSMHMSASDSHLLTNGSPRDNYGTVCFSTPQQWMLVLSDCNAQCCISWSPSLCGQMFSFFLTFICTGVELLGHERTLWLAFRGTATYFLN